MRAGMASTVMGGNDRLRNGKLRRRQGGGKGGRLPPNVEKDGPRNSSKFDEKIGRGVRIHLRCEKIINTKYL